MDYGFKPVSFQIGVQTDQNVLNRGQIAEKTDILIGARDPQPGNQIGRETLDRVTIKQDLTFFREIKT